MHHDSCLVECPRENVGEAYAFRGGFWLDMKSKRGFMRYTTMVAENTAVGYCLETCP